MLTQVVDINNILWDVRYLRSTKHGFDLLFGFRANPSCHSLLRGPARLIVTPQLKDFLGANSTAKNGVLFDLPIGHAALQVVRRRLGFHPPPKTRRPRNWWLEPEPLAILISGMPDRQIAEQLGICAVHAVRLRKQALVLRNKPSQSANEQISRPLNWWRQPKTLELLTSSHKESHIAAKLGISSGYAGRLRAKACVLLNIPRSGRTKTTTQPGPLEWWQEPATLQILVSGLTLGEIAQQLEIGPAHAARLRILARAHLGLRYKRLRPAPSPAGHHPADWWAEPEALQILTSTLNLREIAAKLRISTAHASVLRGRARSLARQSRQPMAA